MKILVSGEGRCDFVNKFKVLANKKGKTHVTSKEMNIMSIDGIVLEINDKAEIAISAYQKLIESVDNVMISKLDGIL